MLCTWSEFIIRSYALIYRISWVIEEYDISEVWIRVTLCPIQAMGKLLHVPIISEQIFVKLFGPLSSMILRKYLTSTNKNYACDTLGMARYIRLS